MSRIAFIFPGQGAQTCGMGKDFYEQTETGRKVFDRASDLLGFSVPELCFEPNDRLDITEYTQAAMVTTSIAMMKVLEERGIHPDVAAGLSLGEYCALAAAGVMSEDDAIRTVRQRGILMQEEVPAGEGAMAAVLALDASVIEEITSSMEGVWIANYNCPGQIVISGKKAAVEEACERLKAAGAKRAILLNVSGPFHSGMLTGAGEKLGEVLSGVEVNAPRIPYVANVTAEYVTEAAPVKELLTRQVSSSVKWQQSVEAMLADGVDTFIEIGPGRTLTGFMRKINRSVKSLNVEKLEDIDKVIEAFKGELDMLEGKIALVTGASRGIGRQIAKTLAAKGATVIVNYNGSAAKAEEAVQEIREAGGIAEAVQCNVSDFNSSKEMLDGIVAKYGRLDILVNNAGITRDNLVMKMSEEDFDAVIQTNLKGVFNCIHHISRQMLKQRSGRIINISSVSGVLGNAGQANYCAAKAGVIGITKSVAREMASRGITVNAIAPGFIRTEMTDVLKDDIKKALMEQIPMKNFGEVEDIANTVAFLASEDARYITGQVISVDGGMAM